MQVQQVPSIAKDPNLDRLATALLAHGAIEPRDLERARDLAHDREGRFDHVLISLGLLHERELAEAYAALLGLELVGPDRFPDEPILPGTLAARFLHDARAVPIELAGDSLLLAVADPLDGFAAPAVAAATGVGVRLCVALPIVLEAALNRLYPDQPGPEATAAVASEDDAERLKDMASEAPVIRLVNQIIARAVENKASDIHIEPFEDRLRIRTRHDGVLHEAESPPRHLTAAITSRIKIMAKLDIAERRLPQDGRIRQAVRGQDIDFRVSTIPSLWGETVVLRVLDRSAVSFDFEKLGLGPAIIKRFTRALDLPNGIVLVTGPTGSGKTTTLYTGLLGLNAISRKIVTIEDPIEYQLRGINQVQVKTQIGLTFASLLRAILRQDPDVIMVGEIRDLETAEIAIQAALTGHLVLSTLHTNSAAATISRLRDMGVEDYLLTSVLRGILAQRLVRRLCPHCKTATTPSPDLARRFNLTLHWHAHGCQHCRNTGYHGRLAVAEFLEPSEQLNHLIFSRAEPSALERSARDNGMVPLWDAGLEAARSGETTLEEVDRVLRNDQ